MLFGSEPGTKWDLDHEAFHFTTLSRSVLNDLNPFLYAVYASAPKTYGSMPCCEASSSPSRIKLPE